MNVQSEKDGVLDLAFTVIHILRRLHSMLILAWFSKWNACSGWEGIMCNFGAHLLASFQMKGILFVHSVSLLYLGSYNTADLSVKFALKTKQTNPTPDPK